MKFRENKGITMVALVVTIVILLILSSVVIIEMNTGDKFKDYQYMKADIEVIEDSILINWREEIPTKGSPLSDIDLSGQASERDNSKYYEVDLEKLGNITLNYGKGNATDKDIYIINEKSHEVYYLKGIEDEEGVRKHQ